MNLYIDGSGVTVFDRDTALPVAAFKHTVEKGIDGRLEARRYVGAKLVVEATQDLLRAAGRRNPREILGAAHLVQQAIEDAKFVFDVEDSQAMAELRRWADEVDAKPTDISTTAPAKPSKKTKS